MSHRDLRQPTLLSNLTFANTLTTKAKKKAKKTLKNLVNNPIDSTAKLICDTVVARFGVPSKYCKLAAKSLVAAGREVSVSSVKDKAMSIMRGTKNAGKQDRPVKPFALSGPVTAAPVSVAHTIKRTSKPRMQVRGDGVVISHSEMIGSILSGNPTSNVTAFRCIGMRANPGISTVFPWLSSVAVNYEKYRFKSLTFSIVPLVATQFSGRVGVGFDYDSTDSPPGNRQEFYSLSTHSETMPWQAASISVKCDKNFKFTGTHVAADNKLIDQGQVILMSDSISNTGTIAAAIPLYDLIVDYEVELIEPQQALFSTQQYVVINNVTAGVPLATGSDTTLVAGPNVVMGTTVSNTVLDFLLPAGTYSFMFECVWTTGAPTITISTPSSGVGVKSVENHGGATSVGLGTITASTDMTLRFTVSGTAYNANVDKLNFFFSRVASIVHTNYRP